MSNRHHDATISRAHVCGYPFSSLGWALIIFLFAVACATQTNDSAALNASAGTETTRAAPPGTTRVDVAGGEGGANKPESPCEITDEATVDAAFGGSAGEGSELFASCRFPIGDRPGEWVDVLYLGAADEWNDIKTRYEEQRGGIVEVEGVGEGAFHPVDHGVRDLVFTANGHVYAIHGYGGATAETLASLGEGVKKLAHAIAEGD